MLKDGHIIRLRITLFFWCMETYNKTSKLVHEDKHDNKYN